jgi:hypothetical protein
MDQIVIEYLEKGLEENALLKLKELFAGCKVARVNVEDCAGDVGFSNGYVLVELKFARNGKVVGDGI